MAMHTENNIYGCSLNPYDKNRTCGGSSGGDAGLVSAKCVPLGIGTDVGGSIRGPASFCGIYGFKPTPMRMSLVGSKVPTEGNSLPQCKIIPTAGPLAYSVNDLVLTMEIVLESPKL